MHLSKGVVSYLIIVFVVILSGVLFGVIALRNRDVNLSTPVPAAAAVATTSVATKPPPTPTIAKLTTATPGITATPSPTITRDYAPGMSTFAPASGPTFAAERRFSTAFFDAAPGFLGLWLLDRKKSYTAKADFGANLYYTIEGTGDLRVAFWQITAREFSEMNMNHTLDRFNLIMQTIQAPKIPVNIGDQAVVIPTNAIEANRDTILAIVRWRNCIIEIYASPELQGKGVQFTEAELTQYLQKFLDAVPNPESTPVPTP